ncbi:tetratricopeptide repeat protein [Xanthomarina sp. F1114]|uniref:tetratricopeptide repeat-containing sensor histidine kinase n=1 Tax=Xanthomarina sp. F1114 TaxID=2996019 RepID=UPI00225E0C8D|nr:tetratricopeptide repeat protein [Xanthomarina sp. F1114]MCX7548460.1 tetratricopeptide repeat protein [Xanthomarina sp. F1114]
MKWFLNSSNFAFTSKYILYFFVISFFLSPLISRAQINLDDNYKILVDRVVESKATNYQYLDSVFSEFSADTLKMNYLLRVSKQAHFIKGESYALNMLGEFYRNTTNYDKAISFHEKALEKAKKAESIDLEVTSLNMLGVVYRRLDVIRTALDYHKEALDLAETVKPITPSLKHSIAISQNSMGNIYLALKQYDMALGLFKKSLVIEQALNNKLGLAINYHNIGYAQEAKGLLDEALKNYQTSLKYNNEIDSDIGRVICYNSIAKLDIAKGRYETALPIIETALEKAKVINDKYYISTSYSNLGLIQLKMQNYKASEKNLREALRIAKTYQLKSQEAETYNHLSQLEENLGNYKTSLLFYKQHVDLDKAITGEKNFQYVTDLILKYESEKKNNQIKALASENEIVKLKLSQNRRILILSLIGAILLIGIFIILQRQGQLKNEKKIVTLEQEMLRNQMNPHFIFNSLNSIKLFIINNEKENAVYYLNKFSKLIRKILIASTEKEISLQDELDTMALYMNIENMRFSNEINYQVHVDTNVNTSVIRVPSLILQPFLENALWHGLSSKASDKQIELNVNQDSLDYISIAIIDNGVGRIVSQKLKEKRKLNRKSVGIDITKARLANFSKSFINDYKIEIEDLYENGKACGTKVMVHIPIKRAVLKTA